MKYYFTDRFKGIRFRGNLPFLVCVILVIYFFWYFVDTDRGIIFLHSSYEQLEILEKEAKYVDISHRHWQQRVNGLRHDSLDLDLLEERVRKVLGYSFEDEIIIPADDFE